MEMVDGQNMSMREVFEFWRRLKTAGGDTRGQQQAANAVACAVSTGEYHGYSAGHLLALAEHIRDKTNAADEEILYRLVLEVCLHSGQQTMLASEFKTPAGKLLAVDLLRTAMRSGMHLLLCPKRQSPLTSDEYRALRRYDVTYIAQAMTNMHATLLGCLAPDMHAAGDADKALSDFIHKFDKHVKITDIKDGLPDLGEHDLPGLTLFRMALLVANSNADMTLPAVSLRPAHATLELAQALVPCGRIAADKSRAEYIGALSQAAGTAAGTQNAENSPSQAAARVVQMSLKRLAAEDPTKDSDPLESKRRCPGLWGDHDA